MSAAILGLMAGFVFVLMVLLLVLIKTSVKTSVKFILVLMVSVFYWFQYDSLQQFTGWPSSHKLPESFVLIASDVREPNKKTGESGRLYWWVRDSAEPDALPRAYELPYREKLHKRSAKVLEQQKQGALYVGRQAGNSAGESLGIEFEKISKSTLYKKP